MTIDANIETSRPAFITDTAAYTRQVDVAITEVEAAQTQIKEDEEVVAVGTNVKSSAEAVTNLSIREREGLNRSLPIEEPGDDFRALVNAKNGLYATLAAIVSNGKLLEPFTRYIIRILLALRRKPNQTQKRRDEEDDAVEEES